jgi:hypothetical protein
MQRLGAPARRLDGLIQEPLDFRERSLGRHAGLVGQPQQPGQLQEVAGERGTVSGQARLIHAGAVSPR